MMSEPPPFQPSPIEPLRVETLPYHTGMSGPGRPGVLVAVGIISIILGCVSILFSCVGIKQGTTRNRMRVIMNSTTVPSGNGGGQVNFDGMPAVLKDEARQIVLRGMDRSATLSPPRRAMLDKLLARAGDKMFPFAETNLTEERVASNISQTGKTASATGGSDDYFIIANGRVEVGDDHASFSPNGRGEQPVDVYKDDTIQQPAALSNQTIMVPTFTQVPTSSGTAYSVYTIMSAVELLLALFLIFAGIVVLSGLKSGRRMHLAFVWLKVPALIVGSIAYYFIAEDRMGGLTLSGGSASLGPAMAAMMVLVMCGPAIIYPIALLIVMNVRSVKEYYRMKV